MSLLREIGPFRRVHSEYGYRKYYRHKNLLLCAHQLEEWFDIDQSLPVYIQIHNRPAKHRLKACYQPREDDDNPIGVQQKDGKWDFTDVYDDVEKFIYKHLPRTFYVEVHQ